MTEPGFDEIASRYYEDERRFLSGEMPLKEQAVGEAEMHIAVSEADRKAYLEERIEAVIALAREHGIDLEIPGYSKEEEGR